VVKKSEQVTGAMKFNWFLSPAMVLPWAQAQQPGTVTPEESPSLVIQKCTIEKGCKDKDFGLVLDSNWRWVHNVGGYQNCFSSEGWNEEFCPDPETCKQNCALEGVTAAGYQNNYGVHEMYEGDKVNGVKLDFMTEGGNVGSRLYVTKKNGKNYKMFKLLNREFTLDVDVSTLNCGMNGAVYFIEMDQKGGKGPSNKAGAKYGTGYCDAQCPHEKFETNSSLGICCVEMDIWEANKFATAYTPHPCSTVGPVRCDGDIQCGYGENGERWMGLCDKDGCDLNTYRMGAPDFYGPGPNYKVDSDRPLTIVTQFLTDDGTDEGTLSEIRRLYVQDGKVISNAASSIPGVTGNAITDTFCDAQKIAFKDYDHHQEKGGLASMGETLKRGMVLSVSIWDDYATHMAWLDAQFPPGEDPDERYGVLRGPCNATLDGPKDVRAENPHGFVKYYNIKYGEIGSTFSGSTRRLNEPIHT